MAIDVRHYANPSHDDYLLLWQYRQSTRFLTLVTAILEIIQEQLIDPWDEFEAELSISAADDHWLDLLGSRLGLIRPYGERDGRILTWAASSSELPPRNTNRRYQWSASGSETDEARASQFRGPTGAVGRFARIDDVQFREFLLAQVWRDRGGRSVTDIERMAGYIFGADSVWVEELIGGGGIKLHISASTDTFFTVLENNQFLPKPAGISLETQWHTPDSLGVFALQPAAPNSQIWKLNLADMDATRTGYYAGRALPDGLTAPFGTAGLQGSLYVTNRGASDQPDHLWLIDVNNPSNTTSPFGNLGTISVSLPGGGRSDLIFPSGMTQLGSDLYMIDGDRGSRRLFRFTSLQQDAVTAVEVGRIPNVYNSVNQPPRSLAALNGDLFVGFSGVNLRMGFPGGLMCKVDPNDVTRTTGGYGTLSVCATGEGPGILGMCAEPGRDDALLISATGTSPGLWRINPNNFADTSGDYGEVSTWADAGVSTPNPRSLVSL